MLFTNEINCPVCNKNIFYILRRNKYPINLTKNQLLKIYSSSSDIKLMDQLVSCKECKTVYLNPRIKNEIILEAYSNAVDPLFYEQNEYRIKTFKNKLLYIIKKFKIQPNKNIQILDIGCGGGAFPKAAHELNFSVIGIEPSKWLSEKAKNEYDLDIRTGTLKDYNFPDSYFDIITLWDVIEHLTDPKDIMEESYRILKSNGLLLINYPDYSSFVRKILRYNWPFFLNVHLIYFDKKTIKRFIENNKFKIIKIKPYWQTLQLGYTLKRASEYFSFFKFLEKILSNTRVYNWSFTYNMGQTMVIAKKE